MTETTRQRRGRVAEAQRIDRLCDEFESAWVGGQRPPLEEFLERVSSLDRPSLLRELLAIEIHHRRRTGEAITSGEYTQRFVHWMSPDLQELISNSLLPPNGSSARRSAGQAGGASVVLPAAVPPKSNRYRIAKMHARGGMGEIWVADDLEIGRRVAYKRMRHSGEQVEERFFSEAQITGQLEHPGVVPVHELGHDEEGNPFYVMRLVQGKTLKDVIAEAHAEMTRDPRSSDLCWLKLLEIFLALCRTVAYAHHRGVIHRDIKPDNIMIGTYGETLVIDWGLAKVLDAPDLSASRCVSVLRSGGADSTATQDGNVLGSPQYMSPEMAEGRVAEEDVRTDIYLLGATLYQVLTNRPPRHGSSREEIINLARSTPPTPPRKVNPSLPRALEAICIKAMAHGKTERYESARQVADEVERYLAGEPVLAYREPWSDTVGRWVRRHRRTLSRTALAAVVLLALTGAIIGWRQAAQQARLFQDELAQRALLDEAEKDLKEFRRLTEQMHFALADTMPLDDRLSFSDPQASAQLWRDIHAITEKWQPDLLGFPFDDRREQLRREMGELTLWRVQQEAAHHLDAGAAEALLRDLDRIIALQPPEASLARLRATCYDLSGRSELAMRAQDRARQARTVPFDNFMDGERLRAEAMKQRPDQDDQERSTWRPSTKHLQEAINAYNQCLQQAPDHFWSHLQKGRCHLVCQEPEKALAEFNSAVAVRPEAPWAWSARGFALAILHQYPAAERDLNYALELAPDFTLARLHRGAVFLQQKKTAQAREDLSAVLAAYPQNFHARYYLAIAETDQGNLPTAIALCNSILSERADLRPPRLLRMRIHLEQGNGPQARADIDQWLQQSDPKLVVSSPTAAARRCQLLRAAAESSLGRTRGLALSLALADGQAAVAGGVKNAEVFNDLATIYKKMGPSKIKEAIEAADAGLKCEGSARTLAELRHARGLARVDMKEYERAKEDFAAEAAVAGMAPWAQIMRADAHALLGYVAALESRPAEAQRQAAVATAQLQRTNSYTPWINLGCVYNALAEKDHDNRQSLQDTAMAMLSNALHQAERVGWTAQAARTIRDDDALESLQTRPDFQKLIP